MSEDSSVTQFDPTDMDFESAYQGKAEVNGVALPTVPWDIGKPQPELVQFVEQGGVSGAVLDIGCGPGDTAIYLAGLGYRVVGLDAAPTAIEQARERAARQGVNVEFVVADATDLAEYTGRFDTVVSSALYHCLNAEARRGYAAAIGRATKSGGRLFQTCFQKNEHSDIYAPFAIEEAELREVFDADWSIEVLRPGLVSARPLPLEAAGAFGDRGMVLQEGLDGLMRLPVWTLWAVRK
ncbi:class I SAM-dependent methyltransferase [Nocardia panacis]|uniref:Class I SAM-dependent methyltransferase n=1 Tax=Nocardia panacis TaxID=2340916 RepID=A0A3A4JX68_9NOCA|nr:class I SAM-dependent methyltransferase [Nocardia panacis]RJO75199.1 class I SAM-dependent methyltransferase [Nocardia panacis]